MRNRCLSRGPSLGGTTIGTGSEATFTSASIAHVFLYNSQTDTGYLLSDLNNDNRFETGVILTGAGSAADMNYRYIINI